ncbi:hypothetical protein [Seinonella peptonophila]|uniref:hypothetical protein n=1 Tax=Seinonella peptonophila TaxID=112248 RepID=UPI001114F270|nr:hypothetical protein [Seinonella peptonophila]
MMDDNDIIVVDVDEYPIRKLECTIMPSDRSYYLSIEVTDGRGSVIFYPDDNFAISEKEANIDGERYTNLSGGGLNLKIDHALNIFQVTQSPEGGCVAMIEGLPDSTLVELTGSSWWMFDHKGTVTDARTLQFELVRGTSLVSIYNKFGWVDFFPGNLDDVQVEPEKIDGQTCTRISGGGLNLTINHSQNTFQVKQMTDNGCLSGPEGKEHLPAALRFPNLVGNEWWKINDDGLVTLVSQN